MQIKLQYCVLYSRDNDDPGSSEDARDLRRRATGGDPRGVAIHGACEGALLRQQQHHAKHEGKDDEEEDRDEQRPNAAHEGVKHNLGALQALVQCNTQQG